MPVSLCLPRHFTSCSSSFIQCKKLSLICCWKCDKKISKCWLHFLFILLIKIALWCQTVVLSTCHSFFARSLFLKSFFFRMHSYSNDSTCLCCEAVCINQTQNLGLFNFSWHRRESGSLLTYLSKHNNSKLLDFRTLIHFRYTLHQFPWRRA